jgi:putative FmdB family regulatory protein
LIRVEFPVFRTYLLGRESLVTPSPYNLPIFLEKTMPIYAYRCSQCGFEKDVLQKMSDPPLTTCPECNQETFVKQLTAAGFQLKGSGWYQTDFKNNDKPAAKTETPPCQGGSGSCACAAEAT